MRTRADKTTGIELRNLLALEQEAADLDASRVLSTLRRRWPIIVLVPLLFGLLGYGLSARGAKVYESTASVVLRPSAADAQFVPVDYGNTETELQTQSLFIDGSSFRAAVDTKLGHPADYRVAAVFGTSMINITGRASTPAGAVSTANTAAETYVTQRRDKIVSDFTAAANVMRTRLKATQDELDGVSTQLNAVPATAAATASAALISRQQSLASQVAGFQDRLSTLEIAIAVTSGGSQIASQAVENDTPVAPRPMRSAVLFAILGVLVGIAGALVIDQLTDVVGSADDLEPALGGAHQGVVLLNASQSASAEAIRTLRTSLQFLALDGPLRRIQVTSAENDEGASAIAANLAVAFAGAGQRVVVVDGDLRTPSLHTFFGVDGMSGFTTVLVGQRELSDVLQPIAMQGWLRVLAAGPRPTNPSELLASGHLAQLLVSLEERCDLVIIDSPPVLPYTDAAVIASYVDATVIVASTGQSKITPLRRALRTLRVVEANVPGVVLSALEPQTVDGGRRVRPAEATA